MDTLLSIKVFRQVVESGSFTAAAAALDMSVAMVSKHVQNLERHLGTRLLHRTSRKVALNDPGALYYERSSEALNLLEEAESALGKSEETPRGTLRLTAPTWFSSKFFARLLNGYRQQCAEVNVDVSLNDKFVDLVEEGLDLALRVSTTPLEARALGPIQFVIVGSAQYLDQHGRPQTLKDLKHHEVLTYAYANSGPLEGLPSHWRTNNTTLMAQLATEGAALTMLPKLLLESYPLEVVLPELLLPSPTLYAVTHGRRHMAARVRTFLDYLAVKLL